jgi:HD-like signal output (HDOD) protein
MSGTEAMLCALAHVVTQGDFTVPPYPAVALRLQRVLEDERCGIADLVEVIKSDAALAASVLAAANSALFNSGAPITNLHNAVSRLGARTVGMIAIVGGVGADAVATGPLLDVKLACWQRTMTCALVCQKLSAARRLASDESFLSGLLHGFGRSIAIASIERLLKANPPARPLTAEEWIEIAEEHRGALAQAVVTAWNLPEPIAEAIRAKPRGASALNDLVLDADAIAVELVAGKTPASSDPAEAKLLEELVSALPSALEALAGPPGKVAKSSGSSSVLEKPEHALPGELRGANVAVVDRRSKAASSLRCLTLAKTGLEIDSSRPFQECAVVRLAVGETDAELESWFTVVLCAPAGKRYRVELQLFCPTSAIRQHWQALYDGSLAPSRPAQRFKSN